MSDEEISQLRDRVEEVEEALKAATDVNRHLAQQVEELSLENDSIKSHLWRLKKKLKHSSAAAQGAEKPASDQAIDQLPSVEHTENEEEQEDLAVVSTNDWNQLQRRGRLQGWLIDPTQVHLGQLAGEGTFGATYKGIWRGAECAVKVLRTVDGTAEAFSRELSTLSLIRHLNVVALYGAVVHPPDQCWLICEWLSGGTLSHWLHGPPGSRRAPQRSLLQRLKMALDVACGMEALEQHDPPILHRDLKPTNVMIDAAGRAKVSDMGLSRILTPEALMELTPETGSYLYMAPEVVRHELYATQADVWSWGCLVSELLTGLKPYSERHLTPVQVALAVADGGLRPAIPATCPPGLAELLASALDYDPLNRPSFAVAAAVMRRVIEEEERKEAAEHSMTAGIANAWNRWMKPAAGTR